MYNKWFVAATVYWYQITVYTELSAAFYKLMYNKWFVAATVYWYRITVYTELSAAFYKLANKHSTTTGEQTQRVNG